MKFKGRWWNLSSKRWRRQSRNITKASPTGRRQFRSRKIFASKFICDLIKASHLCFQNYERADADGTLSRNEILKMKIVTDMKSRTHGDCKSKYVNRKTSCEKIYLIACRYQSQLSKTNSIVREHNTRVMPALLDQLQAGAR